MFPVEALEEINLAALQNVKTVLPRRTRYKQDRLKNLGIDDRAVIANIVAVATFKAEDIHIIMELALGLGK